MSSNPFYRFVSGCYLQRIGLILILVGGLLAQFPQAAQAAPLQATITVTTTADEYGTNLSACSLREAIQAANTDSAYGGCPAGSGSDTINLPAGTYTLTIAGNNEQNNTIGDLDILSNLTISGAGAAVTIIKGGAGWNDKIIDINPLVDRILNVTISGVTVRDGNNTSVADFYGGGIQAFGRIFEDFSSAGTLTLQNCIVTNNVYSGSVLPDETAGGLLADQINLNIDNCTFSNNSAGAFGYGGGISIIGINENISITNSTFSGNSSPSNPGGAIYIRRSSMFGHPNVAGTISLAYNSFETNSATYGGGIYLRVESGDNPVSLNANIHHSIFTGNMASSSGSGFYYDDLGAPNPATVVAENNWWGCSGGPGALGCDTAIYSSAVLDTNPWLRDQLTAVTSPLVVNQSTNLTASFLTNSANAAVPVGDLTKVIGRGVTWGATSGTLSGTQAAVQSNGTATGNFQASGVGTAVIYARVDNDSTSGASSNVLNLTVNKANTTSAITSALPSPSNIGQAVTVNYTVTGSNGNSPTAPTGNVTVSDGVISCAGTVAAGSCNLTFTTAGNKTLTASYAGDANFNASPPSAGVSHTVYPDLRINSADNATFSIAAPNSFTVTTTGTPIPSLAESGALPSGVAFVDNLDGTGTLSGTPLAGTQGSYPITFTAHNGVSADFVQNFTLTVNRAASTTSITSDTPDPSVVGQTVTFNYTVSPVSPATGSPSGNVTVSNGVESCTGTVAAGACTITLTAPSTSNFTATYAGDTSFTGSVSSAAAHTVNQAGTTTTLTADTPDPSVVGQAVTFSFAVSVIAPGAGTPTGNVTVSNGVQSCTDTVAAGSCIITFTAPGSGNFTASYAGDANFTSSTSATSAHTVNQAGTTTALTTSTPNPSVVGQSVTFNYTVNASAPGAGTPTGNVTVSNGVQSCTGTVAAGTCAITLAAVGASNFTATYAGDTNFTGSASISLSQTVNQAATTTTLTSDTPDPSVVGQAVTFSYTISVSAPGAGTPTGNVTVSNGSQSCTGTVAAGSCAITFTTSGTSNFTASYAGDANFTGSTSATAAHTVSQAGTTTSLTADSPDPSLVGQEVIFSYTVNVVAPGVGTPTGNVTVSNGSQSCTGTVAAGSCAITLTAVGASNFTATYAGDANFAGSVSSVAAHTVNQAATTTTLTSDTPDPSVVGQLVTFSYTVSVNSPGAGAPTGNVTVSNGVQSCTDTVAAGSCTITFTTAGTSNFTAAYAGDANFTGSTSATAAHTVNSAGTSTSITSDTPDPSVVGQPVTVSFSVNAVAPGTGTPTGNVTISDGVDSCTGTVAAGSCVITFSSSGTKTLTANYAGDANFTASQSTTETHVVGLSGTTIVITSDLPDPSVAGTPLPVAFTVSVMAPGGGTPTGNVTITDGVDNCTAPVASGTCSITLTTVGGRLLTATYVGDSNYGGSVSFPETHMVEGPPGVTLINSVADTGDGQVTDNEHTPAAITQLMVVFNKDMNALDAGTSSKYQLQRNGSPVELVNSAVYNNITYTTTLNVNGGAALLDGKYTLTVSGTLRDTLGAPIGTNFVRVFYIDTVGIQTNPNGVTLPDGTILVDGTTLDKSITEIRVSFNEDAANPANDTAPDDVTNPANYLLMRPGPNGVFDTATCLAGRAGDDLTVPTGPVTYSNGAGSGPFVAIVKVNNGTPLENGAYRLFICGTTSIIDLAGNHLNGGKDSSLSFTVLTGSGQGGSTLVNPATGFEPGVFTPLPWQPAEKAYSDLGSLWIEIPSLGVKANITGIPLQSQGWDLTWLYDQVGWLEGTAYPTWNGNTVLTAHAYTSNGLPGPFALLKNLKYGDTFIIHFDKQKYIYTVQSKSLVNADDTSLLNKHETLDWVTLITCQQFDEKSKTYLYRWVVRAVLTRIQSE